MSLIQYFDKLHITTKSAVLTVLAQMPFFFISIYLFNNQLIDAIDETPFYDMDFLFVISLCFCLSVTWFAMNLILAFIMFYFADFLYEDNTGINEIFKASTVYSIGYLSISIFINFKANFSLFYFLIIAYGFIVFRMIYIAVFSFFYTRNKKKKNINNSPTN